MRLAGKVALISGGARGMGAAEAKLFAPEGARVVLGDILEAEGKAVEGEIIAKGGQAVFVRLDVAREEDWTQAVALAVSRFGGLHVLVNNAGNQCRHGPRRGDDRRWWDHVMEINAKGVFLGRRPRSRPCGAPEALDHQHPSQLGHRRHRDTESRRTRIEGAVSAC